MSKTLRGACLCGAVAYEFSGDPMVVGHCHCVDCRKASGAGHATHACIAEDAFSMTGELQFYDKPADSGHIVSRGFCKNCGSPVYSTNSGMPGMLFVRAASLEEPDAVTPQMIVYASRAPSWDKMDAALPTFAEMPEAGPAGVMDQG